MVSDKYGYFYFCDRTGDTFRWKGENVSTVEVENILMNILKRSDVVVFGVNVPGSTLSSCKRHYDWGWEHVYVLESEGKAGMAVLLDDPSTPVKMNVLATELKLQGLPPYARPCFIRLTKNIEMTGTTTWSAPRMRSLEHCVSHSGTFKVKKTVLQDEGYDLNRVHEPIFYLNQRKMVYERLTPEAYADILKGKIQF